MDTKLKLSEMAVVLDSDNAEALCTFYEKLLGWTKIPHSPGDEWIVLAKTDSAFALVFQQVDAYERPVWPWAPDGQQQMVHLDFYVDDLAAGIGHAIACGATLSESQLGDFWTVLIDPAGHPFCLLPKRNP